MPLAFPPDYTAELKNRLNRARELTYNTDKQAAYWVYYKDNPVDWINDWCVTYDPRLETLKILPFKLFPRQEQFIYFLRDCLHDKEGGLVEKCRDMGASWLCCAFAVWVWIYYPGSAIGFGSRKEEYVDDKDNMKALLPKIREIINNLPTFMKPIGYIPRAHASYMKIINPYNGSNIIGEAGDNIGRGGRTTLYIKDESAHYERPELIEAALGDNTQVQIDISSVNGSANVFYRRRMAGVEWAPGKKIAAGITRVFIMDWRDHPLKDQKWYDLRYKRAEREGLLHIFKQEVDRDYSGSVDKIIIPPEWVRAAIDSHKKLKFQPVGMKVAAQDVADGGRDKNALAMRYGVVLQYAEDWGDGDAGTAANKAVPECVLFGATELYYDCIGVGAGFKTGINNLIDRGNFPKNLKVYPWDAGGSVLEPGDNIIPMDSQSPTNEDFYYNIKAQGWWSLRTRFYKTFKAITAGDIYLPEELISLDSTLPNLQRIILELSQAQYKYSTDGRVLVDKKPEGATSPNLADSVVMCYFPCRELSILDVV